MQNTNLTQFINAINTYFEKNSLIYMPNNIYFKILNNQLTLKYSNIDDKIILTINGVNFADTQNFIDVKLFINILKTSKNILNIDTLNKIISLSKPDIDNYFNAISKPDLDFNNQFTLSQNDIARLKPLQHCISNEEYRYYLNGVYFNAEVNEVVATDGRRLLKLINFNMPNNFKHIIHKQAISLLLKNNSGVVIKYHDNKTHYNACLDYGNLQIYTKFIDGTFPNYQRVIPELSKTTPLAVEVTFDKKELLAICKDLKSVATDKNSAVKFTRKQNFNEVILSVKIENTDYCRELKYGGFMAEEFGFNLKYLIDLLAFVTSDSVRLQANHVRDPFQISEFESGVYVLMPMPV